MTTSKVIAMFVCLSPFAIGFGAASYASDANDENGKSESVTESKSTDTDGRLVLTESEVAFLNCSLKCEEDSKDGSLFQCLDRCQKDTRIPPQNITKVLSISVGSGVTEGECSDELGKASFVCPGTAGCCCEGYFDCKDMEAMVIGCEVTECSKKPGGREICLCRR